MRARLLTAAVALAMLPAFVVLGAQPASADKNGDDNSGDIKVSTVGGPADESEESHVGCSFDIQWYGFSRSTATVSFEPQGGSEHLQIGVTGPTTVELGDSKSGNDLNTVRTYTLRFTGEDPQNNNGYHVKVTADIARPDGKKGDSKSKVFWSDCDRADDAPPPVVITPGETDPTEPTPPFDWDWQYPSPTCDALTVTYPADIPAGQANDANVTFQAAGDRFTLNFHDNDGTWSGTHVFDFKSHERWPGVTTYHVVWVQVGGTNYHWAGDVTCTPPPTTDEDAPFTWDWRYADPTCTALTPTYPANIPAGQANDANVRFESNVGEFTLNFHDNDGTWSGSHVFDYRSHPRWPAGVTSFHVVWTQVGGTNYHWQGDVSCVIDGDTAKAETELTGFRTGSLTVGRGSTVAANVVVTGAGYQDLVLQQRSASGWTSLRTVPTTTSGVVRVTLPKLTRKGTYRFRLAVPASVISTGDRTSALTVRVR